MSLELPVRGVLPVEQLEGDDEEDTLLLRGMLDEARGFLTSFSWCGSIRESYVGAGVGGVVAVFLFRVDPTGARMDEWLWVIVGDVPPAYLVIDDAKSPVEALDVYIREMSRWIKLARKGLSSKDVIPVNVPATPEWAERLAQRLRTLRDAIRPELVARIPSQQPRE